MSRSCPPECRFPRLIASLVPLVTIAILGCQDDPAAPTVSDATPDLAAASAAALSFRQVSGAITHTCGVTTDNLAYCWGHNQFGGLGDGTTQDRSRPVPVLGGLRFRQVSAGSSHSCGLTTENRAYCWGSNFDGTLGDGTTNNSSTPVAVATERFFVEIHAGGSHTCARNAGGLVFCWGSNFYGQLGDGTTTARRRPVRVQGGPFRQVSVGGSSGASYSCGVATDARAYCWGANFSGMLGDGTTTNRSRPVAVRGGHSFRQVQAGFQHTCGVTTDNLAYCWGAARGGQLGNGTSEFGRRVRPVAVVGGLQFRMVSPGGGHSCGVTTNDRAYCWGANGSGELGNGTTINRFKPVAVSGGLQFRGVDLGFSHSCGVTTGNRAYCWGDNNLGKLGTGNMTDSSIPLAVVGPT